jgi:hypothetical protein
MNLKSKIDHQLRIGQEKTQATDLFGMHNIVTEECPICMNSKMMDESLFCFTPCCGVSICMECSEASHESGLQSCMYCRQREPPNLIEHMKNLAIKNGDAAMYLSDAYRIGTDGLRVNLKNAVHWLLKAASLGNAFAYGTLSKLYDNGTYVDACQTKRRICLEIAAKMGDATARRTLRSILAQEPWQMQNVVRHDIILACCGDKNFISRLFDYHRNGWVDKDVLNRTLAMYKEHSTTLRVKEPFPKSSQHSSSAENGEKVAKGRQQSSSAENGKKVPKGRKMEMLQGKLGTKGGTKLS